MALPGMRVFIFALVTLIVSLFSTKATPAEQLGRVGSLEFKMSRRRANRVSTWDRCSSVR